MKLYKDVNLYYINDAKLKFEKQEIEYAIKNKVRGWEAMGTRLEYVKKQIKIYEEKVRSEDNWS